MAGLLNDTSGPLRAVCGAACWSFGLVQGLVWAGVSAPKSVLVALLVVGVVAALAALLGPSVLRRWDYDGFCDRLAAGSADLAGGRALGPRVPGRVLRWRSLPAYPSWSTTNPDPRPGPSSVLVMTVLTADGARRVAALVPASSRLKRRRSPVLVRLHPRLFDVAIVDTAADPGDIATGDTDPRWDREPSTTDPRGLGEHLLLVGAGLAGFGLGLATAVVVSLAVT